MTADGPLYLDACATTPLTPTAQRAMDLAQANAWGNPSSLHGYGLAAAESLERSRQQLARMLGTSGAAVQFCSGATESVHLALLGAAASCTQPGRLVISAVEHPAVAAAAIRLQQQGWQLARLPVDRSGLVMLERLPELLAPPTRLVSVIWGQSDVGAIQPIEAIGRLCRAADVLFHTDAVQLIPHQAIAFDALPVDLLSLSAHKLGGPRGIGALLVRPAVRQQLQPLFGGGAQEGGLRAGTEPVALAAGFAAALDDTVQRLLNNGAGAVAARRDRLLHALRSIPGVLLSGPEPTAHRRLPHHISLIVQDRSGTPLNGRRLVQLLWQQGVAVSSGSACSAGRPGAAASPVLLAMGFSPPQAAAGLRLSLGHWTDHEDLARVPEALTRAMAACSGA